MFSIFALLLGAFRSSSSVVTESTPASPAAALLESAGARAGLDPYHAHELREAASAWLRVVR